MDLQLWKTWMTCG